MHRRIRTTLAARPRSRTKVYAPFVRVATVVRLRRACVSNMFYDKEL